METPITVQQVEDMLRRIYNQNRDMLKEYGADTWRQYLNIFGPDEVATAIESDFSIYDLYLKDLPEGMYLSDILKEYQAGKLQRSVPQGSYRVNQQPIQPTGFNPQVPWQSQARQSITPEHAKSIYQMANQRAVGIDKDRVLEARKELYFAFHSDPEFVEKVGVSKAEINNRIRNYSGLSLTDRRIEDNLNHNIPPEHHWTGITNSSFLGRQKVDPNTIDQFVREIDVSGEAGHAYYGEAGEGLRRCITNTFLAIDMHMEYKDLGFKIGKFDNKKTRGKFYPREKTIVISNIEQETVAHEIGHYLDWKWAEDFGQRDTYLSEVVHAGLMGANIPEQQRQWAFKYNDFIKSLMLRSDINSKYTQGHAEVFARFIDRFVAWSSRMGRYSVPESLFNDQFVEQDFQNFVRLLQEKSYMDAAYPIKKEKLAQSDTPQQAWMYKFAEKSLTKTHIETFVDTDRYMTDQYSGIISLSKHKFGISVGAQINSAQIGVASYCQYWHYGQDDLSLAEETFKQVKEAFKSTKAEIEFNLRPMTSVMTIMRNKLAFVDLEHRDNPIVGNNRYLGEQYEADWRSSLYGNRYPGPTLDTRESLTHSAEASEIETTGSSSRNMQYRFRYAQTKQPWEMTQSEYINSERGGLRPALKYNGKMYVSNTTHGDAYNLIPDEIKQQMEAASPHTTAYDSGWVGQNGEWIDRSDAPQYDAKLSSERQLQSHRSLVAKAIQEGQKVPDSVLAEYPDLKPKSIPMVLNQPKRRLKHPPEPVIRPFDSKQVEVFDKGASFRYAFEQIDKIKAKQLLYRAIAEVGTNWKDIAKVLITKYNVPKEMMGDLNAEFLQSMSKVSSRVRR